MTESAFGPEAGLPTVVECDEQIAEAQYVVDRPDEYDVEVRVAAHKSLGRWQRHREYAAEIERLRGALMNISGYGIAPNDGYPVVSADVAKVARQALEPPR